MTENRDACVYEKQRFLTEFGDDVQPVEQDTLLITIMKVEAKEMYVINMYHIYMLYDS